MAKVIPGRFTAQIDEPFVVFRLGININHIFLIWKWLPTLLAMQPILRRLRQSRAPGLLGGFSLFYFPACIGLVQYWRSFDELEQFVHSKDNPCTELWQRYRALAGSGDGVGIWYEMFRVEAKRYEVVYDNTPIIGLAAATKHVPALGHRETARRRIGGEGEPAVPSPPNPIS